jgi:hypothetical protein
MLYLIVTASIISKYTEHTIIDDEHRKNRYLECIQHLISLLDNDSSVKLILVENNGLRQTYLDDLKCNIVYTNNNNYTFSHKGANELLDIKEVIELYNIKDDDIVIKLTGRYKMLDLTFLELVKENSTEYDAFIKFFNASTRKYIYDDCVLGLFAVKCKYMKDFKYDYINVPEHEFAKYARENIDKIMEVYHLNMECCFADDLRKWCV